MTAPRFAQRLLLASTAVAMAMPDLALAQAGAEDPNVTVANRNRPDYEPLGIRAGSFLVFPELGIQEAYSDNIGFDEDDEDSDFTCLLYTSPSPRDKRQSRMPSSA